MSSCLLNLNSTARILQCSNYYASVKRASLTNVCYKILGNRFFAWETGLLLKFQISTYLYFAHKAKDKGVLNYQRLWR
jgi:hypothetical protein